MSDLKIPNSLVSTIKIYNNGVNKEFIHRIISKVLPLSVIDIDDNIENLLAEQLEPTVACVMIFGENLETNHICDTIKNRIGKSWENLPFLFVCDGKTAAQIDLTGLDINVSVVDLTTITESSLGNVIYNKVSSYIFSVIDPYTMALMQTSEEEKNTICTPGHFSANGYNQTPAGIYFKQFFGKDDNIFKADLSVSFQTLGSLLDRTGIHREASRVISQAYSADDAYIVTNGTSTSNKIVGNYCITDGSVVVIDRNCHKSATHMLMRNHCFPIYLVPTRNAYGILGGIPKSEFTKEAITAKLKGTTKENQQPVYAIITNSTYDGLFYRTQFIVDNLPVKNIHFDSAWVTYNAFHKIYRDLSGIHCQIPTGKLVFETQSTHKLGLSFSQASQILIKGEHDEHVMSEAFMLDSSTSPFYPIVASTVNSAMILSGQNGQRFLDNHIRLAIKFRKDLKKIFDSEGENGIFDLFQPDFISDEPECWELKAEETWHGFKNIDNEHIYLDPIKITILTKGFNASGNLIEQGGIPATVVSKYLDEHGIIVEKTGPYNILFLFGTGIDAAKANDIKAKLETFKIQYKRNDRVKEMIPSLYKEHPSFYDDMRIQELCNGIHTVMKNFKLPELMFNAFDVLPKQVVTPHFAWQKVVAGEYETVPLTECMGRIVGEMVLPYPPGVPLMLPGESITTESRAVLDFLIMLTEIGKEFAGFETDIHGVFFEENEYKVIVLKDSF